MNNADKKSTLYLVLQIAKVIITAVMGYIGGAVVSSCTPFISHLVQ